MRSVFAGSMLAPRPALPLGIGQISVVSAAACASMAARSMTVIRQAAWHLTTHFPTMRCKEARCRATLCQGVHCPRMRCPRLHCREVICDRQSGYFSHSPAARLPANRSAIQLTTCNARGTIKVLPAHSLREEVATFGSRQRAPGHDRHGSGGVLRAALDQFVGVAQIDEHVALGVAAA